jgi:demethylmenaquinone methyltransferase/2-methoxy-6-polyprenyl-1,4-benzoquinol methylase
MANKYYAPDKTRAEKVNDLFATIAPRYDLINDLQSFGMHRLWKRKLMRLASPEPGEPALDLCCGTGDVAFALAQAGAQTIGLDFSEAMLNIAHERFARCVMGQRQTATKTNPNPEFILGNAQQLPFPDNSFAIVTISYGLRNLADWKTGLREMQRVAKAGGRVLVLDFGKPANSFWRALYFAYLRSAVPLFGKLFCGDSATHGYIYESLQHYPAQIGVADEMRRLGFAQVRIIHLLGGMMSINYAEKN